MICIPKLALEIQDLSLPATVLLPRLDDYLSLGSFDMVDLRLWNACQDDVAPGKFLLIQCACQLSFGLGTSTHVWS
jgi:hypothetical protein